MVMNHSFFEEENEVGEENVVWLKHYSSMHQILLVGEGDFSFSLSIANVFGSATNIVATSHDSYGSLLKKYQRAQSNVYKLKRMGAVIMHGVDATKMKLHADLRTWKFDRIIFNFPHAGFKGKEHHPGLIKMHRELVRGFFKNACRMLRLEGEVHVTHKIYPPFSHWNLEELAAESSLHLCECADFCIKDYPGYHNKRGDGSRSDQPFPIGKCSTFKFTIGHFHKRKNPNPVYHRDILADTHFPEMRFPVTFERIPRNFLALPTPLTDIYKGFELRESTRQPYSWNATIRMHNDLITFQPRDAKPRPWQYVELPPWPRKNTLEMQSSEYHGVRASNLECGRMSMRHAERDEGARGRQLFLCYGI